MNSKNVWDKVWSMKRSILILTTLFFMLLQTCLARNSIFGGYVLRVEFTHLNFKESFFVWWISSGLLLILSIIAGFISYWFVYWIGWLVIWFTKIICRVCGMKTEELSVPRIRGGLDI